MKELKITAISTILWSEWASRAAIAMEKTKRLGVTLVEKEPAGVSRHGSVIRKMPDGQSHLLIPRARFDRAIAAAGKTLKMKVGT